MNEARSLTLNDRVVLKPNQVEIKQNLTIEQWLDIIENLKIIQRNIQFWLGDLMNYGEERFGEEMYQALDRTDYTQGALNDFAWVARTVNPSLRNDNLSFTHHKVVARLCKSDTEIKEALSWAEQENAPTRYLENKLKKKRRDGNSKDTCQHPAEYKKLFYKEICELCGEEL